MRLRAAERLRLLFGADLRSLAILRICLGFLTLFDTLTRAQDFTAHYSDRGVLPRADLMAMCEDPFAFCLHMSSGQPLFLAALFGLAGLAGVGLMLGWKTRLMSMLCWFLTCSIQARNPLVLNSGDTLFRMLLFWGMFLPWGRLWSLDGRGLSLPANPQVCNAATTAYGLQVVLLYLMASFHKYGQPWHDGSAVYYALSLEQLNRPLGQWLLQFPQLLTFLTFATVYFQGSFALLVYCPLATVYLRTLAVLASCLFQLGIGLTMNVGLFTPVAFASTLGLLPGAFWDRFWPLPKQGPRVDYEARLPRPLSLLILLMLPPILLWNYGNFHDRYRMPAPLYTLCRYLHLDQYWGMFAPRPLDRDGWLVAEGQMENGLLLDLRTGQPVNWEKPGHLRDFYHNERWRKYLFFLFEQPDNAHRSLYCRYLGWQWNAAHASPWRIEWITLYFVMEATPAPGQAPEPPKKLRLCHYQMPIEKPTDGFEQLFGPDSPGAQPVIQP